MRVLSREIDFIKRNRMFSALAVGLPLVAILYFLLLFRTGVPREFPVAVWDNDNSPLSRQLTRMIDAAPTVRVAYDIMSAEEGESLMKKGLIDAVIVIPKDMERTIYRVEQADVKILINGVNVTKNGLLERDLRTTLYTFSSGIQIQTLVKKGIPQKQAYDMMMPVYFEKHVLFNPYTSYTYYLLPVFLPMMLLVFILLTTVFSFGSELKNATARQWLDSGGERIFISVLGKIFPYTVIFTFLAILSNLVMFRIIGAPMRGSIIMLFTLNLLFVLAYQSIGVVIIALSANLRLGLSIGGGYSVLAFTFSGYTFPLMAMTPLAQKIALIFPMTYYMRVFTDQAMRGAPTSVDIPQMLYMSVFILLALLVIPRLKRISSDENYWGRL